MGGVLGIAAAVVEKEPDVMRLKNFDQAVVLRPMLANRRELVATGPERGTRGVFERGDRGFGLDAGIDQVFSQGADDAVAPGIDLADLLRMPARSLQDAASRHVDHRGDPARLGVERILRAMTASYPICTVVRQSARGCSMSAAAATASWSRLIAARLVRRRSAASRCHQRADDAAHPPDLAALCICCALSATVESRDTPIVSLRRSQPGGREPARRWPSRSSSLESSPR